MKTPETSKGRPKKRDQAVVKVAEAMGNRIEHGCINA